MHFSKHHFELWWISCIWSNAHMLITHTISTWMAGKIQKNDYRRISILEERVYFSSFEWMEFCDSPNELFVVINHVWVFCEPLDYSSSFLSPWNSGKNIGVGCHFLLQGIFLTQGWNLFLLHWQADSLLLSHQGSPAPININRRLWKWCCTNSMTRS